MSAHRTVSAVGPVSDSRHYAEHGRSLSATYGTVVGKGLRELGWIESQDGRGEKHVFVLRPPPGAFRCNSQCRGGAPWPTPAAPPRKGAPPGHTAALDLRHRWTGKWSARQTLCSRSRQRAACTPLCKSVDRCVFDIL